MTAARILTVRQPWAWAIIHGGKTVENRVRNIAGDYRGPVLIHVAKAVDDAAFEPEHPMHGLIFGPCPRSASTDHNRYMCEWCTKIAPARYRQAGEIIGVVDLVAVHQGHNTERDRFKAVRSCYQTGKPFGPCSPWAEANAHHLVFENPRALDEPIPYRGALGLRKTDFFVSGDWLGQYVGPDPKHGMCTPYGCPPSCYSEPAARLVATS